MSSLRSEELSDIDIEAYNVAGSKYTFEDEKVRKWVQQRLDGKILNACCGPTHLKHTGEIVRVDMNDEIDADYNVRIRELPQLVEHNQFDTIVYDPPWSDFQGYEKYEGRNVGSDRIMAECLQKLLKPDGKIISFGFMSTMMPRDLGFDCSEIAIFRTIGRRKDFFGVVDEQVDYSLNKFGDDDPIESNGGDYARGSQ